MDAVCSIEDLEVQGTVTAWEDVVGNSVIVCMLDDVVGKKF